MIESTELLVSNLVRAAALMGLFVIALWIIHFIDSTLLGGALKTAFGNRPRAGCIPLSFLIAPFLHRDTTHLGANSGPLLVLGTLVLVQGQRAFLLATLIIILISGLGIWLFGKPNTSHVGASGLILGYFGYLLANAFFAPNVATIIIAIIVGGLYVSSLIGQIIPVEEGISKTGHLFGFLGGVVAAVAAWLLPWALIIPSAQELPFDMKAMIRSAQELPFDMKAMIPSAQELPFDMRAIIPKEWVHVGELVPLNVDQDKNEEWLLFYRYDLSKERKQSEKYAGPIGGVVCDQQIDKTTGVSVLARHDLLPEIRAGKGQGFLGENKCEVKPYDATGDGKADSRDLAVLGYGYGPSSPTYLSIFHRVDDVAQGYRFELVARFYGDGGIRIEPAIGEPGALRKVIVNTRLNERSLISKRAVFNRQDDQNGNIRYEPDASENSLVFTYGIPENPYYPEAAVLAYYQLMNEGNSSEANKFLLPAAEREGFQKRVQEKGFPGTPPTAPAWEGGRVLPLALTYKGASETLPSKAEDPIYCTLVTVQESTGSQKVWEVIGLLDGRCNAEICWQFLSWW